MSGNAGVALRCFAGAATLISFLGLCAALPAKAQPLEFWNTITTDDYDGKICAVSLRSSRRAEAKTGKNCVIDLYYPVWSNDGKSESSVQVVKRNATKKEAEKCWGDPDRKGYGLFGLTQDMKVTVQPQYRAIQPIAENVAIAKKCDGTLVIADGGTHTERPFPYDTIAIYPEPFDFSALASRTGFNPPDVPPFVIVQTADHGGGYRDYALIGRDGSPAVVWPNIRDPDSDILINDNGTIYVKMTDPETGATATGIFDSRGTKVAIVPEIVMGMNTPSILGKRNPHPVSDHDRYLYPLDTRTGLPLDLPPDIVGFDYNVLGGQWIVITQEDDGQLRYRISPERIGETLAHYKSLPAFRDIRLVGADDENFSYGKSNISDETRKDWKKPGPAWWWAGQGYAVQLDNGQWEMYEGPLFLDKQPLGATPQEAFNKSYDEIYDQVMAYQSGKALDEQRAVAARQQRHADLIAHFEQHLGQDASNGGCAYPVYSDASMLGGEYLERYVMTYGPCTVYDVDAVCQHDGPACSTARRVKSNWEAQMWQEDAERRALAEKLNQAYQTTEDVVSVLIIEGGQMKQERMSREHYDKYYAPN